MYLTLCLYLLAKLLTVCYIRPYSSMIKHQQMKLPLRTPGWGGRRAGAGRPLKRGRKAMPHRTRERFSARHPLHITMRMKKHVWNLRTARAFRTISRALAENANHLGCRIIDYSVQRNHIHLIVEAKDYEHLARAMRGFAIRIARGLNQLMGTKGRVFAERYHMHVLQTPREVRHARAYVLLNARKHAAQGGVRYPAHWLDPYSSGRYFDGWKVRVRSGDICQNKRHRTAGSQSHHSAIETRLEAMGLNRSS